MTKEQLRMQMLAGIITESQYKAKLNEEEQKSYENKPIILIGPQGTGKSTTAKALAKKLGIPVIAVVDTNHSPDGVDYIIPGNDDSSKAVALYVRGMADAILEGKASAMSQLVEAIKDPEEAIHEEGKAE